MKRRFQKTLSGKAVLIAAAIGAVVVLILLTSRSWQRANEHLVLGIAFERASDFQSYYLDDLGVADINDDGHLDLFTTNHNAQQRILFGKSGGGFDEVDPGHLGLHHSPGLPGAEAAAELPERTSESGIDVYYFRSALVVRASGVHPEAPAELTIRVPSGARWTRSGHVLFSQETGGDAGSQWASFAVQFAGDGDLWIEPPSPRIEIEFAQDLDLDRVRVGSLGVHPRGRRIVMTPKDRHGMAWADYDGDDRTDLFISRGGVRGRGASFDVGHEELFRGDGSGFQNDFDGSGISERGCPGRQVSWEDIDSDGRLDLYLVCGRGDRVDARRPNLLFRQRDDGTFHEEAAERGLALPGEGTFAWLDADNDGDRDLLWGDRHRVALLRNEGGSFVSEKIAPRTSRIRGIAVADIDSDGDLDAFVSARQHALLLLNRDGRFFADAPAEHGLPERTLSASWVDLDNDGVLDFAALPSGLYRQEPSGTFRRTGLLSPSPPSLVRALGPALGDTVFRDARAIWFDANSDGALDVAVAVEACWPGSLCGRREPFFKTLRSWFGRLGWPAPTELFEARNWTVALYHGRPQAAHHWLAVDLVGPPGNRDAIGGRLHLRTAAGVRVAEVGELEGSRYSQGNRRLHFGLGKQTRVESIEVEWPDGVRTQLSDLSVDRRIVVCHPHRPQGADDTKACLSGTSLIARKGSTR